MIKLLLFLSLIAIRLNSMELIKQTVAKGLALLAIESAQTEDSSEKLLNTKEFGEEDKGIFENPAFSRMPPEIQNTIAFNIINKPAIRRWLIQNQTPINLKHGDRGQIKDVCFDPTETKLLTYCEYGDSDLKVWDAKTGSLRCTLSGHELWIKAAAFHPSGSLIISSADLTVIAWNAQDGSLLRTLQHGGLVKHVTFNTDGTNFVSVCQSTAYLWETATGRLLRPFQSDDEIWYAQFNAMGTQLVTACGHKFKFDTWDVQTAEHIHAFEGHLNQLYLVRFNGPGTHLVSISLDGTAKVWHAHSGRCVATIQGDPEFFDRLPGGFVDASLTDDATQLITISKKNGVQVWNVRTEFPVRAFATPLENELIRLPVTTSHTTYAPSFIPISSCVREIKERNDHYMRRVKVWEVETGRSLHAVNYIGKGWINARALFAPTNNLLVTPDNEDGLKIWDLSDPLALLNGKISLNQAFLIIYLFEIDKCKFLYEREGKEPILFDFEKFPHLKMPFATLPDWLKLRLTRLVKTL